MKARVGLSPAARRDIRRYRSWLRSEAGNLIAERYVDALLDWMFELEDFPERGTPRPDLGAKLRTRVFRRSITIAYAFDARGVMILRVFTRGQDVTPESVAGRS